MPRRLLQGSIVSDKGDKTVVVSVERLIRHPVLLKTIRSAKKFHAHDEKNEYKIGDLVQIRECAPKSKLKRWEVIGFGSKG
ncbi:MAG: 30S ribosomal protein S17 [Parvularculaceae bacterium]